MDLNSFSLVVDKPFSANSHTPDRSTPSHARCAENCGSALTHR